MTDADCLAHWPPQDWVDATSGMTMHFSKDAALGLVSKDLRRINDAQLEWRVYDPVTKRDYLTMIGGYSNG